MSTSKDWSEERMPEPTEEVKKQDSEFKAPKDIVLSKEDRLEVENIQLRLMLLASHKDGAMKEFQARMSKMDAEGKELEEKAAGLQHVLWDKYGIDFKKQMIEPGTGRIIPRK
jgi:hypothetical protein